jgi:CRP-like cAMP-binding protein
MHPRSLETGRLLRRLDGVMRHLHSFDPKKFLRYIGEGRLLVKYGEDNRIFSQGENADSVLYIHKGNVKLAVVSERGKEAVIAILGAGDFLGETCLAGQSHRLASATAITECTLMKIDKSAMIRVLREERAFSEFFMAYLISNNVRVQEQLVNNLFNSSEKRLARTLLLLAHSGKEEKADGVLAWITQETLAAMIGTTRETVNHLINNFKKLGFIEYDGGLKVHCSLLRAFLND